MLFLISRAGNFPEAMALRQCDHRNKRYWEEYPEARKYGITSSRTLNHIAGCNAIDVFIFVDSVFDC
jgi:hypothetical protein